MYLGLCCLGKYTFTVTFVICNLHLKALSLPEGHRPKTTGRTLKCRSSSRHSCWKSPGSLLLDLVSVYIYSTACSFETLTHYRLFKRGWPSLLERQTQCPFLWLISNTMPVSWILWASVQLTVNLLRSSKVK